MKNIFFITLMISTLFFMQSCSTEDSTATTSSQTMTDSTGASVSLDGTYLIACAGSGSSYNKYEVVISGTTFTYKDEGFSDDTCATASFSVAYATTFTVGSATTTSGSDNSSKNDLAVTKIDHALQSLSMTPLSEALATGLNSVSFKGYTDWVNGTAKSIIGLYDNGTTNSTQVVGVVSYDIWYINGTSLQYGGGSADTSSTYPTELDYSYVYTKQ